MIVDYLRSRPWLKVYWPAEQAVVLQLAPLQLLQLLAQRSITMVLGINDALLEFELLLPASYFPQLLLLSKQQPSSCQ